MVRVFETLLVPIRTAHFAGVHLASVGGVAIPDDRALLIVANHVSWWDGFLLRAVQHRLRPRARLLTVMSARQLARFPFFRWMGAIGVEQASVSSVRALFTTLSRARHEHGSAIAVAYFPAGRISPASKRPLAFRRGVVHAARSLAPAAIVPVALQIEPLATMRPHAFVLIGEALLVEDQPISMADVEAALVTTMDRLRDYIERTGEDAARDWGARGRPGHSGR